MNPSPTPFETAFDAARKMPNPLAASLVLVELAKAQFTAGRFDDAFRTVSEIPNRMEKKSVLLDQALNEIAANRTEHLSELVRRLVETDPKSEATVGRLSLSLLEGENIDAALSLLTLVEKPFDSDRSRYAFFEKLLGVVGEDRFDNVQRLAASFTDENYRDWARLAMAKFHAKHGRWSEAETLAESFELPRRRSWAFFELARSADGSEEIEQKLFRRAAEILEAIPVEADSAEAICIQLRILGKAAYRRGIVELGAELLEQCEAATSKLTLPMVRFRTRYFLARTLRELGLVADVNDYLDTKAVWSENLSGIQRSRVLQWLAEAGHSDAWAAAVREAARPEEIPGNGFPQAERIAEIVRRYGARPGKPTGDPAVDAVTLSSEEFEEYYFSPFAVDDCGC